MATETPHTPAKMAAEVMEREQSTKTVFINDVASYSSKWIAKFLSESSGFHLVGTVCGPLEEDTAYLQDLYTNIKQDVLLSKLMQCDVIIYNISQHAEQLEEALWAVTGLHDKMSLFTGPKTFILVSTVMTWAGSKPLDPDDLELPLTDVMYWRRRAHPNFKHHIDLEKRVVKMGKTNRKLFSTYVVASGLQYGMGEQIFHFFFKTSWLGVEQSVPVFGEGKNIIPTIHVKDLASVVHNVIEHQPKLYYLLAVDQSKNTMEEIIKAVSSALGSGEIRKKESEESFLIRDLSVMEIDSLQVNLRLEAAHINELFSINWSCETGMVENMERVVDEFRNNRQLLPLCLCVVGPPAVGKTTVSKLISEHYKLCHITLKEAIAETIANLEFVVKNPDSEKNDDYYTAEELLLNLKESMEKNGGVLEDHLLIKVLKQKLMSRPCKNQGFVLDGFPETHRQASGLFSDEDNESENDTSLTSSHTKRTIPEFLLVLDASDSFLKDRVLNLPEKVFQELNYEIDDVLQRLNRYRKRSMAQETVINFFDQLDVSLLCLEITSSSELESHQLMQRIFDRLGPPRTYGCSIEEVQQEERRKEEERMRREEQERAEEEKKKEEEARHRAARWEEWTKQLEQEKQRAEELLEVETATARRYLMEHVMPTLNSGLTECCMAKPDNPILFLANFLLKNNPTNY
ncbi:adenylate kinase 7 isoform X2 [Cheilinus undulatus]|uniref:adenylate kinase 7 isoform X2 n=1 Tax=Cheilinus undulatus TaxID=241271 RepID=UPI001BD22A8C|nr:adenylate kinase 7 isoform X2 [Cheilinus undulatus]